MIKRIAKIQRFLAVLAVLGFLSTTTGCVTVAKKGYEAVSGSDDSKDDSKKEEQKK